MLLGADEAGRPMRETQGHGGVELAGRSWVCLRRFQYFAKAMIPWLRICFA